MNELEQQQLVEEEGMTLQDLFRIVWKNIFVIALITLWVAIIGIVYTFIVITPKYTAQTSLMVQVNTDNISEQTGIQIGQNLIATYKEFMISDLVLNQVIQDVPQLSNSQVTAGQLRNMISIENKTSTLMISISIENQDPALAAQIANTLANDTRDIANDQTNNFIFLQDKLQVVDVAQTPASPSSPNKILNAVISILLGGIIAVGFVFAKEIFNNKFQSAEDVEKYLDIKVIASVPGTIKERKLAD